jgi:hypothetical protein
MPLAVLAILALGFVLGWIAARNVGWDAHVDHVEAEGHARTAAQAAKDRKGVRGLWPFAAVGAFVVAMVVLGMVSR